MRILSLKVRNFLRIKALELVPSKGTTRIGGKNGSGKSSTIKALEAVFGGARAVPARPVHDGEVTGEIIAETEDFTVVRSFDGGRHSSLRVLNKEGRQADEQQSLLDRVFNRYALDPVAIMAADKDKRRDMLIDALGIREKLDALTKEYDKAYTDRRDIGRDSKKAKAAFDSMLAPKPGIPTEAPDLDDIEAQREAAEEELGELRTFTSRLQSLAELVERERASRKGKVTHAEHVVKEAEAAVEEARIGLENAKAELKGAQENVTLYDDHEEVLQHAAMLKEADSIEAKTADAGKRLEQAKTDAANRARLLDDIRAAKDYASAKEKATKTKHEHEELDRKVKGLAAERTSLVASAPFPVEGLAFDDEGDLWVNGQPFEQASQAEQIEVCCGIVASLQPELKIIAVRNASLMDSDTTARLETFCNNKGYDLWLEIVDDANADIVIDDGEIVADNREDSSDGE